MARKKGEDLLGEEQPVNLVTAQGALANPSVLIFIPRYIKKVE